MGGKRKIDPARQAEIAAAQEAEKKKKEKQSLIIRICISAAVLVAAVVACAFMLSHNFNAGREVLQGTYIAERMFVISTASGSDLSEPTVLSVAFCEDGRMMLRYEAGTAVSYYDYEETPSGEFDGVIKRYTDGKPDNDMNVMFGENGDVTLYYTADTVKFTVSRLIESFGEDITLQMLSGSYGEELAGLIVSGDHDSITDEQLSAMGVERKNLSNLSFNIKELPVVLTMHKISDEYLSKAQTAELMNKADGAEVSSADIESATDTEISE